MKQYEYICVRIRGWCKDYTRRLNEYGRDSWELVQVVSGWHYCKKEVK